LNAPVPNARIGPDGPDGPAGPAGAADGGGRGGETAIGLGTGSAAPDNSGGDFKLRVKLRAAWNPEPAGDWGSVDIVFRRDLKWR
jgi:hypothetical protein